MNPRVDRHGVIRCSRCGQPMEARQGVRLDDPTVWLWWECGEGHITAALPVPAGALDTPIGVR